MTLTLSNPSWFTAKPAQAVFKSVRSSRTMTAPIKAAKPAENRFEQTYEIAAEDTWYDHKTPFEVVLDVFWARRNAVGKRRSRKSYRTALKWQALATLPLFPPLGLMLVLLNTCFGLRPKATRVAFIASCAFAMLVIANATLNSDPVTLASLR